MQLDDEKTQLKKDEEEIPASPPFTQVNKHNFIPLKVVIFHLLQQAEFISLDTEFSGLGDPDIVGNTREKNLEHRYKAIVNLVSKYSILALGLSIFIRDKADPTTFHVHNFNFSLFSKKDFLVSASSLQFLVETGLNLNSVFVNGIPFTAGKDKDAAQDTFPLRAFMNQLLKVNRPIVVHNGLLDLAFLYHSFYGPLPSAWGSFVADLSEMFSGGIFDTKYLADYVDRDGSSFLSYLFKKCERKNDNWRTTLDMPFMTCDVKPTIQTPNLCSSDDELISLPKSKGTGFCKQYAHHGYCDNGSKCPLSHDLDVILDYQGVVGGETTKKRRISRLQHQSLFDDEEYKRGKGGRQRQFHSAHYDSYMTGYVFAHHLITLARNPTNNEPMTEDEFLAKHRNKVYLMHKSFPLTVEKSQYISTSNYHKSKFKKA